MDASNFVCCSCGEIPSGVAESGCCHSLFCWNCVLTIGKAPCPSCGKQLNPELCTENIAIQKLIEKIPVKCSFEGCAASVVASAMKEHELICQYAMVTCPNSELCGLLTRKELAEHERDKCVYRTVTCHNCEEQLALHQLQPHLDQFCPEGIMVCPQNCDSIFRRAELHEHLEHNCPNTLVTCPFNAQGCGYLATRSQLETHLHNDVSKHLLMATTMITAQQREIEQLRARVQEIQAAPPMFNLEQIHSIANERFSDFQPVFNNFVNDMRARLRWATLFWAVLILVGLASIPFLLRWFILGLWFARGYKVYVKPFKWDLYRKNVKNVKIVNLVYLLGCLHVFLLVGMIC